MQSNAHGEPDVAVSEQESAYREFESTIAKQRLSGNRATYGPGDAATSTQKYSVDEKLDAVFRNRTKTPLFLAEYDWKDQSGRQSNQLCVWFQMPNGIFQSPGMMRAAADWATIPGIALEFLQVAQRIIASPWRDILKHDYHQDPQTWARFQEGVKHRRFGCADSRSSREGAREV